jgi:hypothetical protein
LLHNSAYPLLVTQSWSNAPLPSSWGQP